MEQPHIKPKKNHDIEVLRALAIALVIAAHISALLSPNSVYRAVLAHFRFGYGVDIFFCISGFIITKSIIKEIPTFRSLDAVLTLSLPFWTRRFWRLIPSATFWILAGLLLTALHGGEGSLPKFSDFVWSALAAAFQYLNVIYPACRDGGTCGTVGVYWSLSLENQFYFLLPVIAVLAGKRWMGAFFGAVFALQFFVSRQLTDPTPVLWAFRTDAIALGVLIALWQEHHTYKRFQPRYLNNGLITAVLMLGILTMLAALTVPVAPVPFAMGLTAVGSALLVWAASYNQNYFARNNLIIMICDYVGSRSYAIYLSHFVVIFGVRQFFFSPLHTEPPTPYDTASVLTYVFTFFALTLLSAEFNYRCIETPLRRKGERISKALKSKRIARFT